MSSSTSTCCQLPGTVLKASNAIGYVVLITVNVLSNTGFFGVTNADVSNNYPTPLTPAGWAFSIWGLIFFLQGCGVVYQQLPYAYRGETWTQEIVSTIGYGWQLGWFFECAWQLAFIHQSKPALWLCTIFLVAALYQFATTLLRLYTLLEARKQRIPGVLFFFFMLPTSINAAWLSVATTLGILIVPVSYGVSNASLEPFAVVLAVLFVTAGLYLLVQRRDAAYGFTLTWALVAVYGNHRSLWIKTLSLGSVVVLSMFSILALTRRRIEVEEVFDDDYEHIHDELLDPAARDEQPRS